jgi:hypothetical protein
MEVVDRIRLIDVWRRINEEYPELKLSYGYLKVLKQRKIIEPNEDIYEQVVIALILRKGGYHYDEILDARDYWINLKRGKVSERHLKAILLDLGIGYEEKKENIKKLKKIGSAIRLYGAFQALLKSGLQINSKDEVSIYERFESGRLSYEILPRKEKKREKEITVEQVLVI